MSLQIGVLESSRAGGVPFLLDEYPGAVAAYSLRKLRSLYNGFCIKVRRVSDGLTLDIGFVNNVLDISTLTTFIGLGSGNVDIWYDQSGNGNNITALPSTNGNLIVISGVLQLQNSKPSINFIAQNGMQLTTQIVSSVNTSVFLIGKANSLATGGPIVGQTSPGGSGPVMGQYFGNYIMQNYNGINSSYFFTGANTADLNFNIINQYFTGASVATFYKNNINIAVSSSGTFSASSNNFWNIGSYSPALGTIGFISEVILYKLDQLSNRTGINANINLFYTIF